MSTQELDVTIEDAWEDYGSNAAKFVVEAFVETSASIEEVLDEACNGTIEDIALWIKDNRFSELPETLSEYLQEDEDLDSKEQLLSELLERIWDNKGNIQFNDVDAIEQLLMEKGFI